MKCGKNEVWKKCLCFLLTFSMVTGLVGGSMSAGEEYDGPITVLEDRKASDSAGTPETIETGVALETTDSEPAGKEPETKDQPEKETEAETETSAQEEKEDTSGQETGQEDGEEAETSARENEISTETMTEAETTPQPDQTEEMDTEAVSETDSYEAESDIEKVTEEAASEAEIEEEDAETEEMEVEDQLADPEEEVFLTVDTWEELQEAVSGEKGLKVTVTLARDVVGDLEYYLEVPSYRTYLDNTPVEMTIDLAGHSIHRPGTKEGWSGYTIHVWERNTLTINDSVGGGSISGGDNWHDGGGIYVNGTLILNGGRITGNKAGDNGGGVVVNGTHVGGAVFIMNGGEISGNTAGENGGGVLLDSSGAKFVMNGGTISGNSAGKAGGGVYMAYGTVTTLNGGTITGNSAGSYAGGIYIPDYQYNTISIGGNTTITGNRLSDGTANNLFKERSEADYKFINVTSPLSGTIGVTMASLTYDRDTASYSLTSKDGVITSGLAGNGSAANFSPDASDTVLGTSDNGEIKLLTAYTVNFNVGSVGARSVASQSIAVNAADKKVEKPADPTAAGWKFDGWYSDAEYKNPYNFDSEVTSDITLYAKWTRLYTVAFNVGSHGETPETQQVEDGANANAPDMEEIVIDGVLRWKFDGWYTDADYGNKFSFDTPVSSNLTLYALWTLDGTEAITKWKELQQAINAGTDVKLTQSIAAEEDDVPLTLPAEKTVTLDLAGYTLDRALSDAAQANGHTFYIAGDSTLVLKDSSGGGKVTGANKTGYGGAVIIANGTFIMEGGEITGNKASNGGDAVYLSSDSGKAILKGGEISGNLGYYTIYNSYGSVTVDGGKISENTGSTGIYSNYGTVTVSDGEISGNSTGIYSSRAAVAVNGGAVKENSNYGINGYYGTITITGGEVSNNAGSGVRLSNGTFTMEDGKISGNASGLYFNATDATLTGGSVTGNKASSYGGGIYHSYGTLRIGGTAVISENECGFIGGGIYISGEYSNIAGTKCFLSGKAKICDNTALDDGGGIYISCGILEMSEEVSITGNEITRETYYTNSGGGGIYGSGAEITINGGTISGNKAANKGGGVSVYHDSKNGAFTMNGGTISDNESVYGGGIHICSDRVSVNITGGVITGNTAKQGGGIDNSTSGTTNISNTVITNNTATEHGGGVNVGGYTNLTNTEISGNKAGTSGGGVYSSYNTVTLNGVKLSNNTAGESGGGIYKSDGTLTLEDVNIAGNKADVDGGGIYKGYSGITLKESSITGNSAGRNGGGVVTFYKYNSTTRKYTYTGPLTLSGQVNINNNTGSDGTADNACVILPLATAQQFIVLSDDVNGSIGVNMKRDNSGTYTMVPGIFTSGFTGTDPTALFSSDYDGYRVELAANGEARLLAPYEVTFNMGGHGTEYTPATQYHWPEDPYVVEPTEKPVEDGYEFEGWYSSLSNYYPYGVKFNFSTAIGGNRVVYAKWYRIPTDWYTVTFNANGGENPPVPQLVGNGYSYNPNSTAVKWSDGVYTGDPTRKGYVFDGWYKDPECTNYFYVPSDTINEDTTLYAKWNKVIDELNLEFQAYGGQTVQEFREALQAQVPGLYCYFYQIQVDDPDVWEYLWYDDDVFEAGKSYVLNYVSLSPAYGYVFAYNNETGTTETKVTVNGEEYDDTAMYGYVSDISLYGPNGEGIRFTVPAGCKVHFDLNGQEDEDYPALQWVEKEKPMKEPAKKPEVEGDLLFGGWYTTADCEEPFDFGNTAITEEMTLYARWAGACSVTFDMKGHGQNIAALKVLENDTADCPSDPRAIGYTFDGWYSDEALTEPFDFESPVTEDTTLYAKWIADTHTVRYELNGHGNAIDEEVVEYNTAISRQPADPSEEGWTFGGWYTDEDLTRSFSFARKITKDTVLYAKWTEALKETDKQEETGDQKETDKQEETGDQKETDKQEETGDQKETDKQEETGGQKETDKQEETGDQKETDKQEETGDQKETDKQEETGDQKETDRQEETEDQKETDTSEKSEKMEYRVVTGNGAVLTKGEIEDTLFVFKAKKNDSKTFKRFRGIRVDGKQVDTSNYDAEAGSVRITLKKPFLETLSVGEHTLTAMFADDGQASARFTINEAEESEEQTETEKSAPKTGDNTPLVLWSTLLMAAMALSFVTVYVGGRRRKR